MRFARVTLLSRYAASQEARQLITFAQSELVETSAEIEAITDAARAGAPEAVVTAARDRLEAEISDVIFCMFLVAGGPLPRSFALPLTDTLGSLPT